MSTDNYLTGNNSKLLAGFIGACVVAAFLAGFVMAQYGTTSKAITITQQVPAQTNPNQPSPQPTQTQPQQGSSIIQNVSLDDDPVKGNDNAKITIVEFSDFQCPFCKRFSDQTESQLLTEYVDSGKAKFVYRDFPLDSIHQSAMAAALAGECADEQGKFWEYHDKLFAGQADWSRLDSTDAADKFRQYGSEINLNVGNFNSCFDSGKYKDEIIKDRSDGVSYGVSGTPTFFIGNSKNGYVKAVGAQPFSSLQRILDDQLSK